MPSGEPPAETGLVLVRAWIEDGAGDPSERLRARVITARAPDESDAQEQTLAGLDAILDVVREFLVQIGSGG